MTWRGELIGEPHSLQAKLDMSQPHFSVCKTCQSLNVGVALACYEAYASGPGLSRLALHYSGETLSPMGHCRKIKTIGTNGVGKMVRNRC